MAIITITTDCGKEITTIATPTQDNELFEWDLLQLINDCIMQAELEEIKMSIENSIKIILGNE